MIDFVHLHLHTGYSLADASLKPKQLAKRVKELGMKAVAITDHGNMFGVIEFYKACKNEGIKPILGIETYVAPRTNRQKEGHEDDKNYHLVLLAENEEGYHNLIQISSDASLEGMYYKPRTDKLRLRRFSKGIIALSACLGGEVQKLLLDSRYKEARECALFYEDIFGKGNFYLELQNHGLSEQTAVNTLLLQLHRDTGIPLVCTNDCHYLEQKDYEAHDVLMAIQAKTTIEDTKRKKYNSDQFYLKSPQEMYKLFAHIPDAMENTVKIADRCNVDIEFGKNKLPKFYAPAGFTNYEYLKKLVYDGAEQLYPQITQEIVDRIEYELETVNRMGYIDYFLITWDFIRYARENGILVGPGRGSGAGSIMLYCLWITRIDPLKYNLLFERFLDPSRVSMPDVDLDYQDDRRNEVIEYVVSKYGRGSVCQIITFGTMAARAAIRAVGRALDYPYAVCDTMAKLVPFEPGVTLNDALKVSIDFRTKYEADPKIKYLIDTAIALEGLPLYTGTHAAGVLITDELGVTAHVPVWKTDKGIVSQFHMGNLEELGLLKMDFLGLSTLTVISKAKKWIKQNYGIDVDIDELYKCEDLKPLQLIKDGHTDGLFQLEGAGMTHFMTELSPKDLEEIIAGISLYRPGPMQHIPTFLANRRNRAKIKYPFKELEPVLSPTYGVLTYQEQCMQTVIIIAGYMKHHSDSFRKAIGKKKKELIVEHRQYFIRGREADGKKDAIPGGLMMGHPLEALEKFYDEMEDFGSYAFNKCFSGEEKIYRGRNRRAPLTIAQMYKVMHDAQYARDRGMLSLHTKYKHHGYGKALSMDETGRLRPNAIMNIHYSGIKDVYLVTTENEETIKCTLNHSFPTPKGKKLLSDLKEGDELYVSGEAEKQVYEKIGTIRHKNTPSQGQCGFQKGGPIGTWHFDEYRESKVNAQCELCENLGKELHHKDGNKDNNTEENYQWLCVSCHKKEHYKLGRTKQYGKGIPVLTSKIKSIELWKENDDVYDVEMAAPNHNLLMNGGIIASNSHGAAYAVIAYLTAWFKFYYPTEFMAALMDSVIKNKPRVARYIDHCQRDLGITMHPPNINISQEEFVPLPGKKIVFSLTAKNVSMEAIAKICEIRSESPISSMEEFFERCFEIIDKQTLEALIAIGALSVFGVVKSRYIAGLDDIVDTLSKVRAAKKRFETPSKSKKPMKKKPFIFADRFSLADYVPDIKEYTDTMNLKLEKNFLGLYLSGHPLDKYRCAIETTSNFKTSDIDYEVDEETGDIILLSDAFSSKDPKDVKEVKFIAVLNTKKEIVTKKKELMAMLEVEDLFGTCKVTVFPGSYEEIKPILKADEIYQIRGRVSYKPGDVPSVIATSMTPISQVILKRIIIDAKDAYQCRDIAKYIPSINISGNSPVYLQCGKIRILLPRECWVDIDLFFRYLDRKVIEQEQITIREW